LHPKAKSKDNKHTKANNKSHLKSNSKAHSKGQISEEARKLLSAAFVTTVPAIPAYEVVTKIPAVPERNINVDDFFEQDFRGLSEKQAISDEIFELVNLDGDQHLDLKELKLLVPLTKYTTNIQEKISKHDTAGWVFGADNKLDRSEFKNFLNDAEINPLIFDTLNSLTN